MGMCVVWKEEGGHECVGNANNRMCVCGVKGIKRGKGGKGDKNAKGIMPAKGTPCVGWGQCKCQGVNKQMGKWGGKRGQRCVGAKYNVPQGGEGGGKRKEGREPN